MTDIEKAQKLSGCNCTTPFSHHVCRKFCGYSDSVLKFLEMAEWKEQQMIEKALQIYLKELVQFNNLLVRLNPEYDKLINVDKSYDDFKRKMKSEL